MAFADRFLTTFVALCLCGHGLDAMVLQQESHVIVNNGNGELSTSLINGILTCGQLTCPNNTNLCSVYQSSQNSDNNAQIETKIQCIDSKGAVIDSYNHSKPNEQGGPVNNYTELSLEGGTLNCVGCPGETPAQIKENMQKVQEANQQRLEGDMKKLQYRMDQMADELSHMFDGIF